MASLLDPPKPLCPDDPSPPPSRVEFWRDLDQMYLQRRHCDLELVFHGDGRKQPIACHSLVLAPLSANLRAALPPGPGDGGAAVVSLPGVGREAAAGFVDAVYGFLSGRTDWERLVSSASSAGGVGPSLMVDLSVPGWQLKDEVSSAVKETKSVRRQRTPAAIVSGVPQEEEEVEGRAKRPRRAKAQKAVALATRAAEGAARKRAAARRRGSPSEALPPHSASEIGAKMTTAEGELPGVEMSGEPFSLYQHCGVRQRKEMDYLAMVGLGRGPDGSLRGCPLFWPLARGDHSRDDAGLLRQHGRTCAALRRVFGLSRADVHYQRVAFARMGNWKECRSNRVNYALKKKFAGCTEDQLRTELAREDILEAFQEGAALPEFQIRESAADVNLGNLGDDQVEGLAVLSFLKSGRTVGHVVRMPPADGDRREAAGDVLRAMFYAWTLLTATKLGKGGDEYLVPPLEPVLDLHRDLMDAAETRAVCREFLEGDADGAKRGRIRSKEKMCDECGLVFPMSSMNDEYRFTAHRRSHFYRNFECDCAGVGATLKERRRHVQLEHLEPGKFEKCGQCSVVTTPQAMSNHLKKCHNENVCTICGTTIGDGSSGMVAHRLASHKDHPQERNSSKKKSNWNLPCKCPYCGKVCANRNRRLLHIRIHKEYPCELCGEVVVGHYKLYTHKKHHHPEALEDESVTCQHCGKVISTRARLREHVLRLHSDPSQRPYRCGEPGCGRSFVAGRELSAHRMQAHIRTRPYACRYGCAGVAYNDYATRGTHERKKHGATFPNAVKVIQSMEG